MFRFLIAFVVTLTPAVALAQSSKPSRAEVEAMIWAKEQAIYQARGRGDMGPYQSNLAPEYSAWPPFRAAPAGREGIAEVQKSMITDNKEVLTMALVGFVLNDDAAVIYYQTHRTRLPNGSPVDEHFEVTHSWVRQAGTWKLMGGMARATPKR